MSEFTWAKRPEPHSTPETWNTRCDGCRSLSCIPQERSRLHPWRYFCEAAHAEVDIYRVTKAECPEHVDLRRRKFR